ncbi:hypothetical protein CLOM_g3032 [Closterium sp. NIES-68]|nr:hypothetical protein CLOM_g3032 [Closterium sp. NIES-68]
MAILELTETGAAVQILAAKLRCISPLNVVEQKDKCRLILDLRKVNDALIVPKFKYEGLNRVADPARQGDWMFSIDLKSGYHHVDIHPSCWTFLGFEFDGRTYAFQSLPFGLATAPFVFTQLIKQLARRWREQGVRVIPYVDDILFLCPTQAHTQAMCQRVVIDLKAAGLVLNSKKSKLIPIQHLRQPCISNCQPNEATDINKLCDSVPDDLAKIIREYPEIFPVDLPSGLPPERPQDDKIELEPGAQPTVRTQWRLTQPELQELRNQLDYLLAKGFIRPSTSPFAAPILFTPKKDGGLRMCTDYRALNRVTIKSRYPIPRTDKLIDNLRGARYFSKIDLRGGYHQIRVFTDDCHKTAFRTRYGSYEYKVMPFGLTNAPSTFQLTMNGVFRDLLNKCVIMYLDDILIYSKTREQHLKDLEAVFQLLQQHQLITKGSKCEFLKQEMEFLGHVISTEGIRIDPKKLWAIQEWKPPTNLQQPQSFLGFVNYVRRFIPNMAGLTGPLIDLLQKGIFYEWGEKQQAAFEALKNLLIDIAIGAVLMQDFGNGLQPIAYESRKMQSAECNNPVHDKEMLAIVHAFKIWRCYMTGADVTVRTDHKSLQYLRAQPNLNPRQIRWLDYLESNFTYKITYKTGANNIADALSRPSAQLAAVLVAQSNPLLSGLFTHGYSTDPFFVNDGHLSITTQKGVYYLRSGTDRIRVPSYRLLRKLLIQEVHDSNLSGHFGVDKTLKALQRFYYWPDMVTDVQRYVDACPICQRMKSSHQRPTGLLQPLEPPQRPWQHVTMDFVTGLPAGPSGNDAVLVVVDRLTKMAHFAPCHTTITAEETARLFISTVVRLHGILAAIISDRDPKFMSKFWQDTWARYGTRLQFSSAYHPQTDGQTERKNQTMEQLIRTNCPDRKKWEDVLPMLEFSYNNAPSATTNHSPFYLNYGMDPTVPVSTNVESQVPRSQQSN